MLVSKLTIMFVFFKKKCLFFLASLLLSMGLYAQNPSDSTSADTANEHKLVDFNKWWNKAYAYTLKDTIEQAENTIHTSQRYFSRFEGKIIRNIHFEAVEMFEENARDTAKAFIHSLGNYLNKTHVYTKEQVIRKDLRFKEKQALNAWQMSENERLLRQLSYIKDARIVARQVQASSDSVDIFVITQDRFPLDLRAQVGSYDTYAISGIHKNFLGFGDRLEAGVQFYGREEQQWGYSAEYQIHNLLGTFIDVGAYRFNNYEKNNYGILIERPFRTTDMKLGGALSYDNIRERQSYEVIGMDSILTAPFHCHVFDLWLGKTFIFSQKAERPNVSIAGRYYDKQYYERPEVKADSNLVFHNWRGVLTSLMLQKITFFQTKKLNSFDVTEDVPVGYGLKASLGHSSNAFFSRPYVGFDFNSQTARPQSGLLQINTSVGGFFNDKDLEDTYGELNINYFSPLTRLGKGEMRHFVFLSSQLLINERYNRRLHFSTGTMGLIQPDVETNSNFAIQYQPRFHLPAKLLGFHFSVAPFTTFGLSTDDEYFSGTLKTYTVHGITLRTKNENLILPTLGIDLRYYPRYGSQKNQFVFSAYLRDSSLFEKLFSPKPTLIRN